MTISLKQRLSEERILLAPGVYDALSGLIAEQAGAEAVYLSGASIAYQLTSIVAGSLAPIIALALYQRYDSALPVALYVGIACAISGISALLARETKGVELSAIR